MVVFIEYPCRYCDRHRRFPCETRFDIEYKGDRECMQKLEKLEKIDNLVKAMFKWGWSHCDDELMLIEQVDKLIEDNEKLRAVLERIANSKLHDMNTLHPSACSSIAAEALKDE